ncbi:MAG: Biosynthetic peptidoglycan transglycosylase [Bacteroidetes bacterium]|nr:Biosynthetic peptidoglycan transglycosylase [Bacteroidota bacterium]
MKDFLKKAWRFTWKAAMWFLTISIVSVIILRWVPIPVTPLMLIRCIEQKVDGKEMKLRKDWVSLDEISSNLQLAVVCSEDQNFLKHNGFDFQAIDKAMEYNEKHKKTRGASTISQQTAKNVFLWPGRSWIRKGFEVYFTFLIEVFWSKQRIMEAYLNVIEMGDGVYGAEAASQAFFKKSAKNLSSSEAATIAAVLPNPRKFNAGRPSAYVQGRRSWIMRQMGYWGGVLRYEEKEEVKPKKKRK